MRGERELDRLRLSQRWLLFGGGALISLAICVAASITVLARIDSYINDQQHLFVSDRQALINELGYAEARLLHSVHVAELWWRQVSHTLPDMSHPCGAQAPEPARTDLGVDGISQYQLLWRSRPRQAQAPLSAARCRRYQALAEHVSPGPVLVREINGEPASGYFFDPRGHFVAVAPPIDPAAVSRRLGLPDTDALIDRLCLSTDCRAAPDSRKIAWLGPHEDPLTGQAVVSAVGTAYHLGRPFAVFVDNLPLTTLQSKVDSLRNPGEFFLLGAHGKPIAATQSGDGAAQARHLALVGTLADKSGALERRRHLSTQRIGGVFVFLQAVPGTDWISAYALDWRSVAAGLAPELSLIGALSAAVLVLLWTVLIGFERYVFSPVHRRAQRVYDSERFNRTVFDTAPIGLCVLRADDGRILAQNDRMRALSQQFFEQPDTPVRTLATRLWIDHRRHPMPVGQRLREFDLPLAPTQGGAACLRAALVKTRYQGQRVLLGAVSDITAQKALEAGLQAARRAADQANHAKSAFLAAMSHEIRTPMQGILGHLELLELSLPAGDAAARLKVVRNASQHLLQIINDILDISKLEAAHMRLESADIDLHALIEQVVMTYAPGIRQRGLALHLVLDPALPGPLRGDAARLTQMLANLVSNAAKFTERGGIIVRLVVGVREHARQWIRMQVEDTGIGIAPERQAQLFAPFTQADASIARRFGGTGLGLSLCRRLAELMGGRISLDSEPGRGSVFTIEVPLAIGAEAVPASPSVLPGAEIILLGSPGEWRDAITAQLRYWGARVSVLEHAPAHWPEADWVLTLEIAASLTPPENMHWIDVTPDGPWTPQRRTTHPRAWQISSFSLSGLRQALSTSAAGEADAAREGPASAPKQDCGQTNAMPPSTRVLVVEDNPVNRLLLQEQLARLGHGTLGAENGAQALTLFASAHVDLVLTDLSMPDLDGYRLARMLRERGATQPIITVTAHTAPEVLERCRANGIDEVIVKPVSLEQLRQVLGKWLTSDAPSAQMPRSKAERLLDGDGRSLLTDTMQADLQALESALTQGDRGVLLAKLHRIKGAFAALGERALTDRCHDLETLTLQQAPTARWRTAYEAFNAQVQVFLKRWQP
ncbi:hybrid sensor histidine kinase/response regulator [Pandoraea sp.]|uniref:hybrid sensor histidine kinase/response regulator n=1 Tax=Pandoraea sp. TaxID=1883445 RepID=UPI0025D04C73|nr:hybrid sensor histidine kinase/response regulator [Pandoraea sp.]